MSFRVSRPSTQSLFVEVCYGDQRISTATAFLVRAINDQLFLITNRHVVTGRHEDTGALLSSTGAIPDRLIVHHNSRRGLGEYCEVSQPLQDQVGQNLWVELPSRRADLVAFALSQHDDIAVYPYEVQSSSHMEIEPAQMVSVVGFPFGERTARSFAVWATGFIASEPEINHGGRPVFLIDCRSRQGQSGSPVLIQRSSGRATQDDQANLVYEPSHTLLGVYSGRINPESDIGVVWKAYVLAELLLYAIAPPN
jgi:hypothetical protein